MFHTPDARDRLMQRSEKIPSRPVWHRAALLIAAGPLLGACTTTGLAVSSSVPTPLVATLPISMGVLYDEAFRDYVHNEKTLDGPSWNITLGDSNVRVFSELLTSLFDQVEEVDSIGAAAGSVNGYIRPTLEEYAFLAPRDAGVDFYSVSMRYRIELYDAAGSSLESWNVNAYGRTRSKLMAGKDSLADATEQAMRDAVAALAVDLQQRSSVLGMIPEEQAL